MNELPGGKMSSKPLHFIWIVDDSTSMSYDAKIQTLNTAIRNAIPLMQKEASRNINVEVLMRAIKFSSGAQWHISQPTSVDNFKWTDLTANGVTDMGTALKMVAEQLKVPPMENRALRPILVLISDGHPTDDFKGGLNTLMELPWGKKAVRMAISIGEDCNDDVLQEFIGNHEIKPLQANNPGQLKHFINWVTTSLITEVSTPNRKKEESSESNDHGNVPRPPDYKGKDDDIIDW